MPAVQELPSTIKRSPKRAQNMWVKAHDSAVKEYGEGRRAHMTAFAALRHSFEKIGDHWEPKTKSGPSDKAAMGRSGRTSAAMGRSGRMAEGVDANASKEHLQGMASKLGVTGRSKMTKKELVGAIKKAGKMATAKKAPAAKMATAKKAMTAKTATAKKAMTGKKATAKNTAKKAMAKSR
ncbi:ChaB family protein [Nonomuraea insulae]|uniref:ChaB family protein n=1 Tax=Nonomuraea insulae TaxID=1616787 RepID=A0ABW1CWA6_9ACTN